MEAYKNLTDAIALLDGAKKQVPDGPAWDFLVHAKYYLVKQADRVMRGEEQ